MWRSRQIVWLLKAGHALKGGFWNQVENPPSIFPQLAFLVWKKVLLHYESMRLASRKNWKSGLMSTSALSNYCYTISDSFSCTVWNGNCAELNGVKSTKEQTVKKAWKGRRSSLIGNTKWLMHNQRKLTWKMKVTRVTGIIWTCKENDGVNKNKNNWMDLFLKKMEWIAWCSFIKD